MLRDQETKKSAVRQPLAYALEPRLLFDGAAIADATTAIVYREAVAQVYQHDNTATEINTSLNATSNAASTSDPPDTPPAATSAQHRSIFFIDAQVDGYKALVQHFPTQQLVPSDKP
ncbi:MAG: Uncharacterised protein [Rhodobiaceae bacterium UBA7378]|nr:MAG: Uncharacterised protein [Rhodobiaceae bacterium UBA7378]